MIVFRIKYVYKLDYFYFVGFLKVRSWGIDSSLEHVKSSMMNSEEEEFEEEFDFDLIGKSKSIFLFD